MKGSWLITVYPKRDENSTDVHAKTYISSNVAKRVRRREYRGGKRLITTKR